MEHVDAALPAASEEMVEWDRAELPVAALDSMGEEEEDGEETFCFL